MSGAFYQRWVPPQNTKPKKPSPVNSKPAFFDRYIPPTKPVPVTPAPEDNAAEVPRPPKRRKKEKVKEPDELVDDDDESHIAKHKSITEKYKRATSGNDGQKRDHVETAPGTRIESISDQPVKHGLDPIPQPMDIDEEVPQIASPLPGWMREPIRVRADKRVGFSKLNLSDSTVQTLKKRGYDDAFAVQTAVIPLMLPGEHRHAGDICVSASTGSGKTLSYVLPMIENLKDRPTRQLRGVIVVPTRELVNQVRTSLEDCSAGSRLRIGIAVGNRTIAEEKAALMEKVQVRDPEAYHRKRNMTREERAEELMTNWDLEFEDDTKLGYECVWKYVSAVDILVCTPGRLVDHLRTTRDFTLDNVEMLAVDEADRLLDQSFQQWVETVIPALERVPEPNPAVKLWRMTRHIRSQRRMQKIILSATMTKDIAQLLSLKLRNPRLVMLEGQNNAEEDKESAAGFENLPAKLREVAVTMGITDEKPLVLTRLLDERLEDSKTKNGQANTKTIQASMRKNKASRSDDSSSDSSSDESTSSSEEVAGDTSDESSSSEDSDEEGTITTSHSDTPADQEMGGTENQAPAFGVLIFTNTNEAALRLSRLLSLLRPALKDSIGTLTKSTKSSSARRMLSAFHSKKLSILIASDRASRGLDIKNLATVLNYDMPTSWKSYVHRVGRTARAGQSGEAFTMVEHHQARWFWNEIGRSKHVRRTNKISRREGLWKEVADEQKEAYAVALTKLGVEARTLK